MKRLAFALPLILLAGCSEFEDDSPTPAEFASAVDLFAHDPNGDSKPEPSPTPKPDDSGFAPGSLADIFSPKPPKQDPKPAAPEPTLIDGYFRLADKTGFVWQSTNRAAVIEHVRRINAGELVRQPAPVQVQPPVPRQTYQFFAPPASK